MSPRYTVETQQAVTDRYITAANQFAISRQTPAWQKHIVLLDQEENRPLLSLSM